MADPDVEVEQPRRASRSSSRPPSRSVRGSRSRSPTHGVHVTKPSVEVTDADVDEWIERARERFAELEPVGRPAQQDDFARRPDPSRKVG